MTQQLTLFFHHCFTMPVLPSTLLVILIVIYGAMVILGALDFDLFDLDLDFDADADVGAFSSIGFVTLKFLNFGELPIMIWLCIYGLVWWILSLVLWMVFDQNSVDPRTTLLLGRNIVVSTLLTKFLTQPLAKIFAKPTLHHPEDLIDQECEISTFRATKDFGQARYQTEAAPLILDVKVREGELSKGQRALIIDYDSESRIYYVVAAPDPP